MSNKLRILSFNCRGLKDWHKRDLLFKDLKDNSVDVCFLQETHCSSKFTANNWKRKWGGTFFWSFGSNRSKGVGIWFKSGLNLQIISIDKDSEGRLLSILLKINNVTFRLANIYAPVIPSERRLFSMHCIITWLEIALLL